MVIYPSDISFGADRHYVACHGCKTGSELYDFGLTGEILDILAKVQRNEVESVNF